MRKHYACKLSVNFKCAQQLHTTIKSTVVSVCISLVVLMLHNISYYNKTFCMKKLQNLYQGDTNTTKCYIIHTCPVHQFTSIQTQKRGDPEPVFLMSIPVNLWFHTCVPHTTAATQLICQPYKDIVPSNTQAYLGGKLSVLGGDSVSYCEKKCSYEHVSHSEWLAGRGSLNLQTYIC